jgi:pyrrolysine biosynthesis protein PylC
LLVAVVGGNLQGVEATYLAHKAGWKVSVVDKNPNPPASGLCDFFIQADVTSEWLLSQLFKDVDLVIPALEDDDALLSLTRWSRDTGKPFAFDPEAYAISSSKLETAKLFTQIGLAVPLPWPDCRFPVLAKPSKGSGSKGVKIFHDFDTLKRYFSPHFPPKGWVLQEYIPGSQHSLEVIGIPGKYHTPQVTDLYVDANFDCKRVAAPSDLSSERIANFEKLSLAIAAALSLRGIMDVEVILHEEKFKALEIDARLPSQTPTTVYWSTGQNMVQTLAELFIDNFKGMQSGATAARGSIYEHIRVTSELLEIGGEHIMTGGGPLYVCKDFFGADEAITNFAVGKNPWVATLIISGPDRSRALVKRNRILNEIVRKLGLKKIRDPIPAV